MSLYKRAACTAALACVLVLGACVDLENLTIAGGSPSDPYEQTNRAMFAFNQGFDEAVLKPASEVYTAVVPEPAREGVSRVLANLKEPRNALNNALQGNPERAAQSLARLALNTTVGLGGLWDPAEKLGLLRQNADFGQTLATLGADSGPYLMLPVLGPSNPRDLLGFVADAATDPLSYFVPVAHLPRAGGATLDQRTAHAADIETINSSLEPYAAMRSMYTQHRAAEVRRAKGLPATPAVAMDYTDPAAPKHRQTAQR